MPQAVLSLISTLNPFSSPNLGQPCPQVHSLGTRTGQNAFCVFEMALCWSKPGHAGTQVNVSKVYVMKAWSLSCVEVMEPEGRPVEARSLGGVTLKGT